MGCRVFGCQQPLLARGLCQFHYDHQRRYPTQPINYVRPNTMLCVECGTEFAVAPRGSLPDRCRDCRREQHRAKSRERRHRTGMREYGLTPEQYRNLSASQLGRCAICRLLPETGRGAANGRLSVDHDHDTGRIRGLLCHRCNSALGLLREDPDLMRRAADYVERTEVWAS